VRGWYVYSIGQMSNVSWQSLETRTTWLDPQSSKLKNFEDWGSSRVARRSRPVGILSRPFENLWSRVKRLLSGNKQRTFHAINFWKSESQGKHFIAFFTSRFILSSGPWFLAKFCLSENLLPSISFFNLLPKSFLDEFHKIMAKKTSNYPTTFCCFGR